MKSVTIRLTDEAWRELRHRAWLGDTSASAIAAALVAAYLAQPADPAAISALTHRPRRDVKRSKGRGKGGDDR